jgi:hypothetical protein
MRLRRIKNHFAHCAPALLPHAAVRENQKMTENSYVLPVSLSRKAVQNRVMSPPCPFENLHANIDVARHLHILKWRSGDNTWNQSMLVFARCGKGCPNANCHATSSVCALGRYEYFRCSLSFSISPPSKGLKLGVVGMHVYSCVHFLCFKIYEDESFYLLDFGNEAEHHQLKDSVSKASCSVGE